MSSVKPAETTTPHKYQLFIDGQFVDAESGKTFNSPNPATGETFAEVAEADKADIDKAVAAARKALTGKWSQMSARDRGRLLYNLSQLIGRDAAQLAELVRRGGRRGARSAQRPRPDRMHGIDRSREADRESRGRQSHESFSRT